MTHNGHGSEPRREERAGAVPPASDGAGPPPGGEPWWAQDPSPAAAAAETEDESTQQIRHLGRRPERPQPPGAVPADPQQPWPLQATPGAPGAPGAFGGPEAAAGAAARPPYGGPPQQPPAGPPPGAADDGAATQLIPPVAAAPQQRPGDDSDATQLIPPLAGPHPGAPPAQPPAQPPFAPPPFDEEAPRPARHAAPVHTQFEGLFRDTPGGPGAPGDAPAGDPGATQRLPPVRPAAPAGGPPPSYGGPQQPAAHSPHAAGPPPGPYGNGPGGPGGGYYDDDDDRRGGIPRWAAIAIGTAACAAVGITAGWLLSSGDGGGDTASGATPSASADQDPGGKDGDKGGGDKPVEDDPAEEQAKELDALLAESNDSRDAVIRSVENIRQCKALGKAARDLRGAAGQRRDLVARLEDLSVDELPSHQDLTRSLTDAWNASASADDHYARWADAAKRGKGCGGGGNHMSAGNRASGDATAAKEEAAGLWNPIAEEYGLTQRQATEL